MLKKYYYNAMAYRLQCYADPKLYKLAVAQADIYEHGLARFMNDAVKHFFKDFSQSEIDYRLKRYDEIMITKLLNSWATIRKTGLTPIRLIFLYDKVKFKKVMRLNIGFNPTDFKFDIMAKVFDCIFTSAPEAILKETIHGLPDELQDNILKFNSEVKEISLLLNDK